MPMTINNSIIVKLRILLGRSQEFRRYTFSFDFPAAAGVCGADLEEMKHSEGNVPHLIQI